MRFRCPCNPAGDCSCLQRAAAFVKNRQCLLCTHTSCNRVTVVNHVVCAVAKTAKLLDVSRR